MATAIQVSGLNPAQIRTIRQTVAKDANDIEFDLFMEAARSYGLDPFRKQIISIVFNKDKPDKRQQAIIVSRDGLRVLAQRCKDYRPASDPSKIVYDKNLESPENPLGIVSATVTLFKQDSRGEWYPVIGEAYWDEFAPVKEEWAPDETGRRRPTGKKTVDGNWAKMPRLMISKCAEAQALRAGWPDQFGNIYSEEEFDRLKAEATASEMLREYEQAEREARTGGRGLLMVFDDAMKLEKIPLGQVADRCMEFVSASSPEEIHKFRIRNEDALREFWAAHPADALDLKKAMEAKEKLIGKSAA